jgi:DNA-binding LytR/AlgR family response regulator
MEKFNCLIVEDEPLAAEVLQDYVSQIPFLHLEAVCNDAISALDYIQQGKIDVLFLDIHLPRIKGLDFAKTLKRPPQIIITTAYREYALDGYEVNAVDYLIKPINFHRFLTAVNKLKVQTGTSEIIFSGKTADAAEERHIFININKKRIKIYLQHILYVESRKEYIRIVTTDKSYLTKFQLSEFEEQLDKNKFIRIHRSFIIAKEKINAFTAADVEINGEQIPIGRSYKELVLSVLGEAI